MERSTELRTVRRSIWGEIGYRMNWIVFGLIACILLAFIPVIGWIMAAGIFVAVLWKTFGFRETQVAGSCPVCTKSFVIEPKTDVFACPACGNCLAVRENSLVLLKID